MAGVDADGHNLAELLRASGYQFSGESPNMEMISKLPQKVKARVSALKANQMKTIEIETNFYARVHELEKEMEAEFNKVYEERRMIVSGEHEPNPAECTLPIFHGQAEEEITEMNEKSEADKGEKGIPEFWLTVLKTADNVADLIEPHDEPILKYLTDVTTVIDLEPAGFSLFFHFAPNPYFKNSVLTKKYTLQIAPDADEPFDYDGPSVEKCTGDKIQWNDGKDVTKKIVKKKQKKGSHAGKFLTKTVKSDSFFNFFDPPQITDEDHKNEADEEDQETHELLQADFELGQVLRDHVIPRAVLFFTGEAAEGDAFDEEGEDEDGDDFDEDDEE